MHYYSGPDLARSFRVVRKNTLQIAHDIPEAHYGFRATPDTRSVMETLVHVAVGPRWQQKLHGIDKRTAMTGPDFGAYIGDANAYGATLTTRAAVIKELDEGGERFARFLEALTPDELGVHVEFGAGAVPPSKTRFDLLMAVKEHEMHHRAQLMVIERLLGITPHLTRARQQQNAQATAATAR
jgi:uncharacterized damage-inducible protein DinB